MNVRRPVNQSRAWHGQRTRVPRHRLYGVRLGKTVFIAAFLTEEAADAARQAYADAYPGMFFWHSAATIWPNGKWRDLSVEAVDV